MTLFVFVTIPLYVSSSYSASYTHNDESRIESCTKAEPATETFTTAQTDEEKNNIEEDLYRLMEACESGSNEEVARILDVGNVTVNSSDVYGLTPLILAAFEKQSNVVEYLILRGADVNSQDHYKNSAIHCACMVGDLESVRLLIQVGADLDLRDEYGVTPVEMARKNGHLEVVDFLEKIINEQY